MSFQFMHLEAITSLAALVYLRRAHSHCGVGATRRYWRESRYIPTLGFRNWLGSGFDTGAKPASPRAFHYSKHFRNTM